MKKHLLSTSAIALGVAMAAPASAQEWNMKWGGFYNVHVGYSDVDDVSGSTADFDGVNIYTNAEIIFRPSVTLDNGLTFGAEVQLEAMNTGGARVDESFVSIYSDTLGRIDLGSENSAGYKMMVTAPGIGIGINSPSVSAFIPVSNAVGMRFRRAMISAYTEVAGNNDVQRITYYTPSFNGLTLGVSYAPGAGGNVPVSINGTSGTGTGNSGAVNIAPIDFNTIDLQDIWDFGLAYNQSFNGVDLSLSARYGTGDSNIANQDDPDTWGIGASVSVSGWTIGGHYAENDEGNAGGLGDEEGWALGVAYDIPGPWRVAFDTFQGERKIAGGKEEYTAYQLGARRTLGKGVAWQVYAVYAEGEDKVAGDKVDGTVIATSINLSF
ncbi:porin [Roseovarius autotrophicus]|uniref:porin n=1 Tax=Roseovarius autotrophicus TaxID=2824121 RepID=UPI001FFCDF68|nr:porin [Roseovarius autotrophicus]